MNPRTQLSVLLVCFVICGVLLTCGAWATGIQVDFLLSGLRHPSTDEPLTGGKVYSYAAGTTTPKALYTDAALTTPASNPVILSAYGQANVYGSGKYKFVIKDADSVTLLTLDNLEYSSVSTYFADTTDPFGSSLTLTNLTVNGGLAATLSANLNAAGYGIASMATPTLSTDAANKGYVDVAITAASFTQEVVSSITQILVASGAIGAEYAWDSSFKQVVFDYIYSGSGWSFTATEPRVISSHTIYNELTATAAFFVEFDYTVGVTVSNATVTETLYVCMDYATAGHILGHYPERKIHNLYHPFTTGSVSESGALHRVIEIPPQATATINIFVWGEHPMEGTGSIGSSWYSFSAFVSPYTFNKRPRYFRVGTVE